MDKEQHLKFLATGDPCQLSAIEGRADIKCSAVQDIRYMFPNRILLKENKRLKDKDEVAVWNQVYEKLFVSGACLEHVINFLTNKGFGKKIMTLKKVKTDFNMAMYNSTVRAVNKHINETRKKRTTIRKGDNLVYNGYIKRLKLSKYDTYKITHSIRDTKTKELTYRMSGIDKCGQEINFAIQEEEVNYNFTYPYCYTVHSLQGRDTDEKVTIFNTKDLNNSYESKKWFWTAITRCKSLHNISYYLGDPVNDSSLDLKDTTIERRIIQYKEQDTNKDRYEKFNYITVKYVRNMIKLVNYKCPEEDCDVEFTNSGSSSWSVDRIDNNLGHNKGNVKIMCLRCNKSKH